MVYVHVAKDDEVVTLQSGAIVPALVKLNTFAEMSKTSNADVTFDLHNSLKSPKLITYAMLDRDGDV